MRDERLERLRRQLADSRGGRVLFVAHCLLNTNVRYLGGAGRPAAVTELVQAAFDHEVALVQMPCPEERAWGGVLKRNMLAPFGRGARWANHEALRRPMTVAVAAWTSTVLLPLASHVASRIEDYQRSGLDVVGVVGIGCSPSCGVTRTLDLDAAIAGVTGCPLRQLDRDAMKGIVATSARPGPGIFTSLLQRSLRRRRVMARFFEHDLLAELAGDRTLPPGLEVALRHPATV